MEAYLIITGILFAWVGLRGLTNPLGAVAEPFGLVADNVDAKNYLRSGAGGVTLACAAVLVAGGIVPALSFAALLLAVTVLAGLVAGRLFSLLVDGNPGIVPWVSIVFEALGALMGGYWLLASSS